MNLRIGRFRLVPEILNAVDVIVTVGNQSGMVDAKGVKVGNIQHVVAPPTVGIDDTIRDNPALDDRDQSGPDASGITLV